jgi:hypothetical protein
MITVNPKTSANPKTGLISPSLQECCNAFQIPNVHARSSMTTRLLID